MVELKSIENDKNGTEYKREEQKIKQKSAKRNAARKKERRKKINFRVVYCCSFFLILYT